MNTPINFDHVRDLLLELAQDHGESLESIRHRHYKLRDVNWQWNYTSESQQKEFESQIFYISEAIKLYETAKSQDDLVAAKNGIMMAKIASQNLGVFFDSLASDLATLMRNSEHFNWPEFPDPYEVPESYNYKGL